MSDKLSARTLIPSRGERLANGCWRCQHCGWIGPERELLPRHFEGDSWLTYLCPDCRWMSGVAISKEIL